MLSNAADIKIVGVAYNGQEAIDKARELKPDVITLDVEMPVMDGVTALKKIKKVCDAKVLMLSSLTYDNAKVTIDALEAGAADFLLKSYESLSSDNSGMIKKLHGKIREIHSVNQSALNRFVSKSTVTKPSLSPQADANIQQAFRDTRQKTIGKKDALTKPDEVIKIKSDSKIIVIGASTGGPLALKQILTLLPKNYPLPIIIIQHMPSTFTGAFAERLNDICSLNIIEATDRMPIERNNVYIAPGGQQMLIEGTEYAAKIRIHENDRRLSYSPSVDLAFGAASKVFSKKLLGIILTGMGNDGTEGSRLIKQKGGQVWVQDEPSSVVYGMPKSVHDAGLSDAQLPLELLSSILSKHR
jgi:two-component system chemotaxis response regulator CheB